jgi:hypothetical protein
MHLLFVILFITCGKLSGRDSNITNNTPIGTVTCFSKRPSASWVLLITFPNMLVFSAICFIPSANTLSFFSFSDNRESKTELKSFFKEFYNKTKN